MIQMSELLTEGLSLSSGDAVGLWFVNVSFSDASRLCVTSGQMTDWCVHLSLIIIVSVTVVWAVARYPVSD